MTMRLHESAVNNYSAIVLGGATATALGVLLETGKTARFAARGFLRNDSAHFDNQHCVYLYRLP